MATDKQIYGTNNTWNYPIEKSLILEKPGNTLILSFKEWGESLESKFGDLGDLVDQVVVARPKTALANYTLWKSLKYEQNKLLCFLSYFQSVLDASKCF